MVRSAIRRTPYYAVLKRLYRHSEIYIIILAICLRGKCFSMGYIQCEVFINSTRSSLPPSDRLKDCRSCLLAPTFVRVTASFYKLAVSRVNRCVACVGWKKRGLYALILWFVSVIQAILLLLMFSAPYMLPPFCRSRKERLETFSRHRHVCIREIRTQITAVQNPGGLVYDYSELIWDTMLSETSQPRLSCCCFVLCDAVYLSGDVSAFPKKLLPMSSGYSGFLYENRDVSTCPQKDTTSHLRRR